MIAATNDQTTENPHRREWALSCHDAFGRPSCVTVVAERGPNGGTVAIKTPVGEYGSMGTPGTSDLVSVLAEANEFANVPTPWR